MPHDRGRSSADVRSTRIRRSDRVRWEGKNTMHFLLRASVLAVLTADGRMIWQKWTHSGDPVVIPQGARMIDTSYVQQRLTLRGVKLLRSTILATGLFQHNLTLNIGRQHAGFFARVRRGDHMVSFDGLLPGTYAGTTNT